jgi:hypothetical protein
MLAYELHDSNRGFEIEVFPGGLDCYDFT